MEFSSSDLLDIGCIDAQENLEVNAKAQRLMVEEAIQPVSTPIASLLAPKQRTVSRLSPMLIWMFRALRFRGEVLPDLQDAAGDHQLHSILRDGFPELAAEDFPVLLEAVARKDIHIDKRDCRYRNARILQKAFRLGDVERDILLFAYFNSSSRLFHELMMAARDSSSCTVSELLAGALGYPEPQVQECLAEKHFLNSSGLLVLRTESDDILLEKHASLWLDTGKLTVQAIREYYFWQPEKPALHKDNFSYLQKDLNVIVPYLQQASSGQVGVNILITGMGGAGKTSLVSVIARECGVALLVPRSHPPLLKAGLRLLEGFGKPVLLLWDEYEGYLNIIHPIWKAIAPVWNPTMMIGNPVPAIWICKDAKMLDHVTLARFDYVLNIDTMPSSMIKRVMRRSLGVKNLPAGRMDALAKLKVVTPGMVRKGATVVSLADLPAGQRASALEQWLFNHVQATGVEADGLSLEPSNTKPGYRCETEFDAAYSNTSTPLSQIVAMLQRGGEGRFCLYGLPGTGKTAFVHHVGEQLGRKVLLYSASDLLARYVGETEQKIAKAFAEARKQDAVLLLDEVDTFLFSREGRTHSWEISQVTELLVQMEQYRGIFFAATNMKSVLDAAAIRRFDWKIEFLPLRSEQTWQLFCRCLGKPPQKNMSVNELLRKQVMALSGIVPADFSVAMRKFRLTGELVTAPQLLAFIREEAVNRSASGGRPIGFVQ